MHVETFSLIWKAASVFRTELFAFLSAVRIIFTLPTSCFTIFSDSGNVLFAAQHFILSLHSLLLSFFLQCRGYHVRFCWVPAQRGVWETRRLMDMLKRQQLELYFPPPFLFVIYPQYKGGSWW